MLVGARFAVLTLNSTPFQNLPAGRPPSPITDHRPLFSPPLPKPLTLSWLGGYEQTGDGKRRVVSLGSVLSVLRSLQTSASSALLCMPQARRATSPARSSQRLAAKKMNVLVVDGGDFDTTSWVADAVKGFAAELPNSGRAHLRDTLSECNSPLLKSAHSLRHARTRCCPPLYPHAAAALPRALSGGGQELLPCR